MKDELVARCARELCIAQGYEPTENELARASDEVRAVIPVVRKHVLEEAAQQCGIRAREQSQEAEAHSNPEDQYYHAGRADGFESAAAILRNLGDER